MAFDEGLAQRVREVLADHAGVTEKKMFGGLAFMVDRHMCCGIIQSELMVRVGKEAYEDALAQPHAREMDFTGRSLKGMVYVGEEGLTEDSDIQNWVQRGLNFVETLPPK
ncbi:MAG: TfoX family protein [Deltaproteobacteria bacterium]|nr:MAG: TfoX family protein [Deltaproteobacteria bacterium]